MIEEKSKFPGEYVGVEVKNTHHPRPEVRIISEKGNREIEAFIRKMSLEKQWEPETQKKYRETLYPFYEVTGIAEMTAATVEDVYNFREHMKARGLADQTVYRRIGYIKTFFLNMDMGNFSRSIVNKEPESELPYKPSLEEVKQMYTAASEYPATRFGREQQTLYTVLVSVMFYCGLRRSEVVKLELADIDYANNTIYVIKSKRNKSRRVPIHEKALKDILTYMEYRPEASSNHLFLSLNIRKQMDTETVNRIVKTLAAMAGIDKEITSQSLRRAAATYLHKEGMPLRYIQKFLGHAKIETTIKYIGVDELDMSMDYQKRMPRSLDVAKPFGIEPKLTVDDLKEMLGRKEIDPETFVHLYNSLSNKETKKEVLKGYG